MDTRDYFAGQALNGLIERDDDYDKAKTLRKLAALAYRIADAMLEERNHPSHPTLTNDTPLVAVDATQEQKGKKGKRAKEADTDSPAP